MPNIHDYLTMVDARLLSKSLLSHNVIPWHLNNILGLFVFKILFLLWVFKINLLVFCRLAEVADDNTARGLHVASASPGGWVQPHNLVAFYNHFKEQMASISMYLKLAIDRLHDCRIFCHLTCTVYPLIYRHITHMCMSQNFSIWMLFNPLIVWSPWY